MMCSLWFFCGLLFNSGRKKTGCHFWLPIDCAPVSRDCPCGIVHHFVYCETGQSAIATSAHRCSGLWFFAPSKNKKGKLSENSLPYLFIVACSFFGWREHSASPPASRCRSIPFVLPYLRGFLSLSPYLYLFVPKSPTPQGDKAPIFFR